MLDLKVRESRFLLARILLLPLALFGLYFCATRSDQTVSSGETRLELSAASSPDDLLPSPARSDLSTQDTSPEPVRESRDDTRKPDPRLKMSRDLVEILDGDAPSAPVRLILQARPEDLGDATDRRAAIAAWVEGQGFEAEKIFTSIGAAVVVVDPEDVWRLADLDQVSRMSLDARVRTSGKKKPPKNAPPPASDDDSALPVPNQCVGADLVWEMSIKGDDVTIAIVDSGVDADHVDLWQKVTSMSFVDEKNKHKDRYGHGTHVALIAAGDGNHFKWVNKKNKANPVEGIAPKADVLALRVLDGEGAGYTSAVIEAIEAAIAKKDSLNVRVLNLSLGHPVFESYMTDPLTLACAAAVDAGIAVVASVGNSGSSEGMTVYGGINSPANAPWVIGVGAVNGNETVLRSDDTITTFSSRGPTPIDGLIKPDLVAPGYAVAGGQPVGEDYLTTHHDVAFTLADGTDDDYMVLSGTSMAAPIVSGTLALMFEANPSLNPNTAKALLLYTAEKMKQPSLLSQGSGYLNAEGAVRLALAIRKDSDTLAAGDFWLAAESPEASVGMLQPFSKIAGETVPWGSAITWGDTILWSFGVVLEEDAIWGDDFSWTNTILWSFGEPWFDPMMAFKMPAYGDTILWSFSDVEGVVWSDTIMWTFAEIPNVDPASFVVGDTILWSFLYDTWSDLMVDPSSIAPNAEEVFVSGHTTAPLSFGNRGSWFFPVKPKVK